MPYDYSRTDRVGGQIQKDLSQLIRDRVKDPRVGMVTILDVEVTKDLAYAKVYFDAFNPDQAKEAQEGLNRAAGFLRRELGRGLKLRVTPNLEFIYDDTQERGNHLSALIDKAIASDSDSSE